MSKINFQNVHTMIGADARIDGPIRLQEGIIIYGQIHGDVVTDGPVRVAQNALVQGNISGSHIRIGGTVVGNIAADGQVLHRGEKTYLALLLRRLDLLGEIGRLAFGGFVDLLLRHQIDNRPFDGLFEFRRIDLVGLQDMPPKSPAGNELFDFKVLRSVG